MTTDRIEPSTSSDGSVVNTSSDTPTSPPSPPPTARIDAEELRKIQFEFSGEGKEYFKIWIVNIVLTILTLGIYSAWAKVRNKQYFYGNTTLDGKSFEYMAKPLTILKGRLIAFVFIGLYYGLTSFAPFEYQSYIVGTFAVLFIIFFPWVVINSLKFNARNSRYCNIAFGFEASYWGAFRTFILWPITAITIVLIPFIWQRRTHFFVNNSRYGTQSFKFNAGVGNYYSVFGILVALTVSIFIVFGLIITVITAGAAFTGAAFVDDEFNAEYIGMAIIVFYTLSYLLFGLLMRAYYICQMNNIQYQNTQLDTIRLHSEYSFGSYLKLLFTNTLGIIFTLGLFTPFALVRMAKYHASKTRVDVIGSMSHFIASEEQKVNAAAEGFADGDDLFDVGVGI